MRIIKLPELKQMTGLSRSSIYALAAKGQFPRPIPLSTRASGWLYDEVSQWLQERAEMRA